MVFKFAGGLPNATPDEYLDKWDLRYQELYTEAMFAHDIIAKFRIEKAANEDYQRRIKSNPPTPPADLG